MTGYQVLVDQTAARMTMIATMVLFAKMFAASQMVGAAKIKAGHRPPEDEERFLKPSMKAGSRAAGAPSESHTPIMQPATDPAERREAERMESRWSSILSNDMENIPMGLLIAWNSCLFGLSNPYHVALLTLFTVSRLGHTYAYAMGMQPHRTMAYTLGSIAVVGLGLNALWGLW